jgi:hypothetical protein
MNWEFYQQGARGQSPTKGPARYRSSLLLSSFLRLDTFVECTGFFRLPFGCNITYLIPKSPITKSKP